jgi:hypothetical protein
VRDSYGLDFQVYTGNNSNIELNSGIRVSDSTLITFPTKLIDEKI